MVNQQRLSELLAGFLADSGCPGGSLGIAVDGEIISVAAGVTNLDTGVETTIDTVFQIGSVTKTWTATLVMQLVDEGKVDLDVPLRTYLPDFATKDDEVSARVTVRHLLAHTSGIEGDVFDDVGTNDDCLDRYVTALAEQGNVHDLDQTWSYCNSGYVVLGRLIEVVDETLWDTAIKQRLGAPLGMAHLGTTAGDAIIRRAAAGHIRNPETSEFMVAPVWSLPRALGPAGLVNCSVADLLAFARLHLEDGRAPDGTQVLSAAAVKLMREPQAACPEPRLADAWGLGWMLNTWDGRLVVGHYGNTVGQSAYLQMVPDRNVAVVLLTNLTGGGKQADDLLRTLLAELADVVVPDRPEPTPGLDVDLEPLVGEYARYGVRSVVDIDDGKLRLTVRTEGALAKQVGDPEPESALLEPSAVDDSMTRFVGQFPHSDGAWTPVTFYAFDDAGRPTFIHFGARVTKREG